MAYYSFPERCQMESFLYSFSELNHLRCVIDDLIPYLEKRQHSVEFLPLTISLSIHKYRHILNHTRLQEYGTLLEKAFRNLHFHHNFCKAVSRTSSRVSSVYG